MTVLAHTIAEARVLAHDQRFWWTLLSLGCVIGLTGPFGTFDDLPLLRRMAYWLFAVMTTFWLGYLTSYAVTSFAEIRGIGGGMSLVIGAFAAGVLVTLWLSAFHGIVFETAFWSETGRLLPYVMVITLLAAFASDYAATPRHVSSHHAPPAKPVWLAQLPDHLGTNLILLQAEDHYVRAETDRGETLLRTTLQEASEGLGDYGIRLHRSWWVAKDAVAAYRYRNGAPAVVLQDGRIVPVGRTYRRAVKEAMR
ncbi:LytTR family DNA-binding domain-containing protein [Cognatiyoonia sp. IB215446]|uniref:LytTR family DNA-binding domain-containing protein n=1 Tax=Cognatiyoonia sp. IB215446 TaxID=3097355 RepID=UPI002A106190|nr:LytTR family DNA-binding domain-containing protein [Cognatiyoonia sp. IB215446]MDX8349247.1 LytTR family DNA-binding domain-containing protein [Cognatiyoonia sp. IB215446]